MMDSLGYAGEDSVAIPGEALRTSQPAGKQVCAKALGQDLLRELEGGCKPLAL